jgi:hypothetical protein
MLVMSDRTRRRITLALFAVLCVTPTLVVAAWGVSRHLPGHVRGEAQRLSWQLGMKVSLAAVEHLRPGVVRYEGLVLANPETGQEVARCRTLEAAWGKAAGREKPGGPLLRLSAVQPEIEASALDEVRRLVDRVLTGRAGPLDAEVGLSTESLVVRSEHGWQTFSDVTGKIQTLPQGTLAKVEFRLPGQTMTTPAWVYLGRSREQAAPASVFGLETEGSDLPCPVLALAADGLRTLGTRSRFRGRIDGRETAEGWETVVCGQFDEVELERLLGDRFPSYQLSGNARLRVDQAILMDGRLQRATGKLTAGPGDVNTGLVDAAIQRLGLTGSAGLGGADRAGRFEWLKATFSLDAEGLRVVGLGDEGSQGTILMGHQGPILGEPRVQPLPIMALVGALISGDSSRPLGQSQGSAGPQAEWLLRRMPLPDIVRFAALRDAAPGTQASRTLQSEPR